MEDLNYFSDDFLSNGEFHQLYSTGDYFEDICLWDNRIFNGDQQQSSDSSYFDWNSAYSDDNCASENCYNNQFTDFQSDYSYFPNTVDGYAANQSVCYQQPNEQYQNGTYANDNQYFSTETFLTDMDQWKQNHLDDLMYQSNNNNDWEVNLENLLFDNSSDVVSSTELPARTYYCNDSCTSFLQETSEHLNLQTFRPQQENQSISAKSSSAAISESFKEKNAAASNEDKEFVCTYGDCRKVYAKAGHLKAHIRRHVGDKPYVCLWPNCTWRFSRSDELSRHRRSHSGIKPYKCDYCPKCFSRSDHLTKHRKVHERKMAALKIKAVWTNLPPRRPGRKPKHLAMQE